MEGCGEHVHICVHQSSALYFETLPLVYESLSIPYLISLVMLRPRGILSWIKLPKYCLLFGYVSATFTAAHFWSCALCAAPWKPSRSVTTALHGATVNIKCTLKSTRCRQERREAYCKRSKAGKKHYTAFLKVSSALYPLACQIISQQASQTSGGCGALWLSGCQLKVIGHVAFIMLPLGGRGQLCMCVSTCTRVWSWRMGEGCLHNSEQWECTVVPPPGSDLPSPALHTQWKRRVRCTHAHVCMRVAFSQYGCTHRSEHTQTTSFV